VTAAVIHLSVRRRDEPTVTATPGWRPCPLAWCGGNCTGGDSHHHGGSVFVAARRHRRVVGTVTADVGGDTAEVTVALSAYEDYRDGLWAGTDIELTTGGDTFVLGPAQAAELRAVLGAAERYALLAPAAEVAS
jgi:hypothetical protein